MLIKYVVCAIECVDLLIYLCSFQSIFWILTLQCDKNYIELVIDVITISVCLVKKLNYCQKTVESNQWVEAFTTSYILKRNKLAFGINSDDD